MWPSATELRISIGRKGTRLRGNNRSIFGPEHCRIYEADVSISFIRFNTLLMSVSADDECDVQCVLPAMYVLWPASNNMKLRDKAFNGSQVWMDSQTERETENLFSLCNFQDIVVWIFDVLNHTQRLES